MKWNNDNTITVIPPAKPKKITGTRFAAVLGLNDWTTPFNAWCAITRTYEAPFEDTIYTIAGKTIEPKQADYMKGKYFWKNLITPTDVYGEDYFKKTWGDFFPNEKIYGGMWDYLFVDKEGKPETVLDQATKAQKTPAAVSESKTESQTKSTQNTVDANLAANLRNGTQVTAKPAEQLKVNVNNNLALELKKAAEMRRNPAAQQKTASNDILAREEAKRAEDEKARRAEEARRAQEARIAEATRRAEEARREKAAKRAAEEAKAAEQQAAANTAVQSEAAQAPDMSDVDRLLKELEDKK